jgi:hypothetical protein
MTKILTGAILTSYRPLSDKSFNLALNIQEPSQLQRDILHQLHQQAVYILIKSGEIDKDEQDVFDAIDGELFDKKSQSERIRNVYFVLWKQDSEGHEKFKDYYKSKTEIIINHLKSKII